MKFETLNNPGALIKKTGARDYVIALDGLEFAFQKDQLEKIRDLHNNGYGYKEISKIVKRDPYEVIVGLLHHVYSGRWIRPFY